MQVSPQLMRGGTSAEVTVPDPVFVTVRVYLTGGIITSSNVAVQVAFSVIVICPLGQFADHSLNSNPSAGVGVSETIVFSSKSNEQVSPQSMPAGEDETYPVPTFETVSVYLVGGIIMASNVAVQVAFSVIVICPFGQFADHSLNSNPSAGVCVRETGVFSSKS